MKRGSVLAGGRGARGLLDAFVLPAGLLDAPGLGFVEQQPILVGWGHQLRTKQSATSPGSVRI